MPTATLTLEDSPEGMKVSYSHSGQAFDHSSQSHNILAAHLDTLAPRQDGQANTVPMNEVVDILPAPPRSMLYTPVQRAIQIVRS